jgi:hypothetical protein
MEIEKGDVLLDSSLSYTEMMNIQKQKDDLINHWLDSTFLLAKHEIETAKAHQEKNPINS